MSVGVHVVVCDKACRRLARTGAPERSGMGVNVSHRGAYRVSHWAKKSKGMSARQSATTRITNFLLIMRSFHSLSLSPLDSL